MRTGQEYLESLRDGRRVYVGGELIEDVTTHPKTRGYAEQIARYYDLHLEPEHQDVLTYVDDDGNRQSMHWFLPRSKEDVQRRRAYHEFWFRHFKGGIFTRPPAGMNVVMYAQADDPAPWAENSVFKGPHRDLSGNIERAVGAGHARRRRDLADVHRRPVRPRPRRRAGRDADAGHPGGDRRGHRRPGLEGDRHDDPVRQRAAHRQPVAPGPDARADDLRARPVNTPGVSIVARESRAQPDADPYDRPLADHRRRARRDGLLRRRPHPLGPGPARRQPRPREVVPAAPVRLGPHRDPDPPLRARRAHGRPGAAAHRGARHEQEPRRAVPARRPRPLPRDLPRVHDLGRGDRVPHRRRPLQAEQHLRGLRPRPLPRAPARDGEHPHRLLRPRRGAAADEARARGPVHRPEAPGGAEGRRT